MTTKTKRADATVAELEQALLNGENVTADELDDARKREQHQYFTVRAAEAAARRDAEAAHQHQLEQLRADIHAQPRDELIEPIEKARDALAAVVAAVEDRNRRVNGLIDRAEALGVEKLDGMRQAVDESGIGWQNLIGPGGRRVRADDRALAPMKQADELISRIAYEVIVTAGLGKPTRFSPHTIGGLLSSIDQD